MGPRMLVCGGREFSDREMMWLALDGIRLWVPVPIQVVIHGAQRGADTLADVWAKERGLEVLPFEAEWTRFQGSAGPIRNRRILREGLPDFVVAFPGGDGTQNMLKQAWRAKVTRIDLRRWDPAKDGLDFSKYCA